jgi:hypothetical protein
MSEGQKKKKKNWKGMDWIDLAHDRGRWRALVINLNEVFEFQKVVGIY